METPPPSAAPGGKSPVPLGLKAVASVSLSQLYHHQSNVQAILKHSPPSTIVYSMFLQFFHEKIKKSIDPLGYFVR